MAAPPDPHPSPGWRRLTLELRIGADPISGALHAAGELPLLFEGWLGLAAALEAAAAEPIESAAREALKPPDR